MGLFLFRLLFGFGVEVGAQVGLAESRLHQAVENGLDWESSPSQELVGVALRGSQVILGVELVGEHLADAHFGALGRTDNPAWYPEAL